MARGRARLAAALGRRRRLASPADPPGFYALHRAVPIGQLLIAVVGVGYLFELYSRSFLMAEFWALLIIVFAFAFAASEAVARLERRVAFYASSR